ncbi:hypothetical protein ACIGXM_03945 [Kitasatospora sp. NPDC052896]|uniref:hypothetical protein n=1 Tax=Kitasatospora sp. NPDC052896 TaxID=3364061 RepID=UPI0037C9A390
MRTTARTTILLLSGVALALALVPSGVTGDRSVSASAPAGGPPAPSTGGAGTPGPASASQPPWDGKTRVIGDGSTSYTGPQPNQRAVAKLKPGEKPPQFVVVSWDGALEGDDHMFSHFRQVAKENNAQMTFFLSGIYLLPNSKRALYHPPQHGVGDSAIDFPTNAHIKDTLAQLSQAWEDGDEIGTHFNGHFCGQGGGGDWSTAEWESETQQAYSFVENWKTNTGYTNLPPLPFDYQQELVGGRAPCLEGQKTLIPAEKAMGWRYDASSPGDFQLWPNKIDGVWNFPLQEIPYQGQNFQVLSMDYNFLANQSGGDNVQGDPSKYAGWLKTTTDTYLNGFERVYNGSRAPYFIGNHFEDWNGGIYMQAVENVVKTVCGKPDVRCVSFKEMADWLDAQDPKVIAQLRNLDPGQAPDWSTVIK